MRAINKLILNRVSKYAIIILVLSMGYSNAELEPKTLENLYKEHLVFTGKIISKTNLQNYTRYIVEGDFLNKSVESDTNTVIQAYATKGMTDNMSINFNLDDFVQIYVDNESIGYVISPYSFKLDEKCGSLGPSNIVHLLTPQGQYIHLIDPNGNSITHPNVNSELVILYEDTNDTPFNKVDMTTSINAQHNSTAIYSEKQQLDVEPCIGKISLKSHFIPAKAGNYTITVTQKGGMLYDKVILNNKSYNFIFSVNENLKPTNVLTPLHQIKHGIYAKDVVCKEGFQLIMKAENGSPACVKPDTANILLERGWAQSITK